MQGHFDAINSLTFPWNFGEIFVSASGDEIRVWTIDGRELLRIELKQDNDYSNAHCNQVELTADGKTILSAWSDGKIRAFLPQSGKLKWAINDAHAPIINSLQGGVTALTSTSDCQNVISGGSNGEVKVWNLSKNQKKVQSNVHAHS